MPFRSQCPLAVHQLLSEETTKRDKMETESTLGWSTATGPLCFHTDLATLQAHTCAITSKGTLYMWGGHREGQLGLGRPTYVSLQPCLSNGF